MEVTLPGTEHAEPRSGWSFLRGGVFRALRGVGSFRRFPNPPTWAEFAVAAGLWAGFPRLLPVGQLSYLLLRTLRGRASRYPLVPPERLDTTTPAGKAMFQMMGVFAEFERAMIAERVRAGLARARGEGKRLGSDCPRTRKANPGSPGDPRQARCARHCQTVRGRSRDSAADQPPFRRRKRRRRRALAIAGWRRT